MNVAAVDRSATQGDSRLHAAAPRAKLVAFALVLAAVVATWNPFVLAALVLLLCAAALLGHLDGRLTFTLAAYPAVFAAIFAFASAPSLPVAATIVLKALTAALAAVVLVLTTPYPQIFAPIQRITPMLVGDALLMTYRTLFLLLERFADLLRAIRLRSGTRSGGVRRAAGDTASALGNVVLYSIDLAQRDYDVMRVRGYSGRLRVQALPSHAPRTDASLVAVALLALATSALWTLQSATLDPYSWLLPLPALAALLLAGLVSRRNR